MGQKAQNWSKFGCLGWAGILRDQRTLWRRLYVFLRFGLAFCKLLLWVYFLDGVVVARRAVVGLRLLLLRVPVIIWRWGVVEGSVVVER